MSFTDFLTGRVWKINDLHKKYFEEYASLTLACFSKPFNERTLEESACIDAGVFSESFINGIFNPDLKIFLKYVNNLTGDKCKEIWQSTIVMFLYSYTKATNIKLDEENLIYNLEVNFEISKFRYFELVNVYRIASADKNELLNFFYQMCRIVGADINDYNLFMSFAKLYISCHKKAISLN